MGVTRAPTDMWTAQQLREATPFRAAPKYLIRDNDAKYGSHFAAVAAGIGIEVIRAPIRVPRANAICERLLGSVRRECLDHILVINVAHLRRVLNEYVRFFNRVRPHQGIKQRVPVATAAAGSATHTTGRVISVPVLGGLHHEYQRVASGVTVFLYPVRHSNVRDGWTAWGPRSASRHRSPTGSPTSDVQRGRSGA